MVQQELDNIAKELAKLFWPELEGLEGKDLVVEHEWGGSQAVWLVKPIGGGPVGGTVCDIYAAQVREEWKNRQGVEAIANRVLRLEHKIRQIEMRLQILKLV